MKKLIVTASLLLCAFILFSCGTKTANQDIVPYNIVNDIIDEYNIDPVSIGSVRFSEAEEEDYLADEYYMLTYFKPKDDVEYTADLFESYAMSLIPSASVGEIFELVIVKLPLTDGKPDSETVELVQKMCEERIVTARKIITEYASDLASYAQNVDVVTVDNYIFYVIAKNKKDITDFIKNGITKG